MRVYLHSLFLLRDLFGVDTSSRLSVQFISHILSNILNRESILFVCLREWLNLFDRSHTVVNPRFYVAMAIDDIV